jgi:S-DNA-T family DNA segregation ATPase FtsK/SpoIIIE
MEQLLQNILKLENNINEVSITNNSKIVSFENDILNFCANTFSENAVKDLTEISEKQILVPPVIKIGTLLSFLNDTLNPISIPALIPFSQAKSICFEVNDTNRENTHRLIQLVALNIIQQLPMNLAQCYFVDMKELGLSFPFINSLNEKVRGKDIITDETVLKNTINYLIDNNKIIITKYLTHRFRTLQDYNISSEIKEPFKFMFVANFPKDFSKENINKISKLIENGDKTGFYFVFSYDKKYITDNYQQAETQELISKSIQIKTNNRVENFEGETLFNETFTLNLTNCETDYYFDEMDKTISQINEFCKQDVDSIQDNYGLEIQIGKDLSGNLYFLTLGKDTGNHHLIIGGSSGMGKTNLLNCICIRTINAYSPEKVKFVLLDCAGTHFSEFKDAVHTEKICKASSPEESISVVLEVEKERQRRQNLFDNANVSNLVDYVSQTNEVLPRIILVIDEFQLLFQAKKMNDVNLVDTTLVNILRLGKKFGIHLILCTQSLGDGIRSSILDNINLRVALNMNEKQSMNFLNTNNYLDTKSLKIGQAIINPSKGEKHANQFVRIDKVDENEISEILNSTRERYAN